MLCGNPPFNGETDREILRKVKDAKYSFSGKSSINVLDPIWSSRSSESKDLI